MYKGAIIGFGKIARTNHLPAYQDARLSERLKITSVVEPDIRNLEIGRTQFPGLHFYASLKELFENEQIDFADITCPPRFHVASMDALIERGIALICEKPFTLNMQDAEAMREKLLRSGLLFLPCHQYKYSPIWKEFKNAAEKVPSGALLQFNVFRMEADPGIGNLPAPWRAASPEQGGGILLDTGVHYLYLLHWLYGVPNKVMARLHKLQHKDYACEDTALLTLEYEKAIAQINVTWAADRRYNDARFISDKLSLYYEGRNQLLLNTPEEVTKIAVPDASDKKHYTSLYTEMFSEFAAALESGTNKPELIEEAYQSVALVDRCITSSNQNRTA